jgi:hypothetical protein
MTEQRRFLLRCMSPDLADCVAKLFSRPNCAILIQELAQARNLDSRHRLIGFDYCAFAAQHRVLQQNLHEAAVPAAPTNVRSWGHTGLNADCRHGRV